MKLMNMHVATKLWATLLGLLLVLSAANMWGQINTAQVLEQARADVQRLENKITAIKDVQGAGLRLMDVGVAMTAASDAQSRQELRAMFEERAQRLANYMQVLERQLVTPEDRKAFAAVAQASASARDARAEAARRIAEDDYQAHRDFAFGTYARTGEKYEAAIRDFIDLQVRQSQAWVEVANVKRERTLVMAWGITGVLLLLGIVLARWLIQTITQPLETALQVAERIGQGDLTVQAKTDRQDEFGQLLQALDGMAQRLRTVVAEVRDGVVAVSSAAGQIASGNQDLSVRTEQSAANLQETAASVEQLNTSVMQAAQVSRQANELAVTAVQAAEQGGQVVQQVVSSMEQINTSSRKINDIIGVIDGIAFQTNILALNAAVEAARAGEQGRGFAVVAGEVRALAGRSAEAAKEIKGLIEASVQNVDVGAQQVHQAGQSMENIVASVRHVTQLMTEITTFANQQSDGFSQVNTAVGNLDQMTQQNAALVEESTAAAQAMHEQAQRLQHAVSVFKLQAHSAAPLA